MIKSCDDMDASFHQLDDAKARARHLLTCPVCSQKYEDPRVLPCHHTFCCRCLVAHVDRVQSSTPSSTRVGAFPCPLCAVSVGLPAAGASAFPVDERIRNIRDLVVEEMAKDLASRFKGRLHGDGLSNGRHGGVSAATRLSNISERPGVDDDEEDYHSTRPSRHFGGEESDPFRQTPTAVDDPVFSRQRPGYLSGTPWRSRADTATNYNDSDARFGTFSEFTHATTAGETGARFSRDAPGYHSMHMPRSRRPRPADSKDSSMYDSIGRSQGRNMTSYGNGHSAEPLHNSHQQRPSSYVDVSPQSSPFDNLNREDDLSEPYTPKIGQHRLAYSSLRERRRRPVFDPNQLYEHPVDFVDREMPNSFASGRFSKSEDRFTDYRHSGTRSHTFGSSEFSDGLRREAFANQNWTRMTSDDSMHQQKLAGDSHSYDSHRVRSSDDVSVQRNRPDFEARRQSTESVDTNSVLTVLSHLPADLKAAGKSNVSDPKNLKSQSGRHDDEVSHQRDSSETPIVPCSSNEVPTPPVSDTQTTVDASQSSTFFVIDEIDAVLNTEQTDTATSVDVLNDISLSRDDSAIPCLPNGPTPADTGKSADKTDANFNMDKQCQSPVEGVGSPTWNPSGSCFTRLTKFRNSKNSKHPTSSVSSTTQSSTSEDPDYPNSSSDKASASTVPSPKPRVRKRPQVFVPTPFSFADSGSGPDASTSPPSAVRIDKSNSESESCDKEDQNAQQLKSQSPLVSDNVVDRVCDTGDGGLDGGVRESVTSSQPSDVEVLVTSSADVSPTTETDLPGSAANDVRCSADDDDDVSASQSRTQPHDEDSAVYSAVGVDSDASLRSATEPCLPTPTSDLDVDDALISYALDDPVSSIPSDQHSRPTDVISSCPQSDDLGVTNQSADDTATDIYDECQPKDAVLSSKDHDVSGGDDCRVTENDGVQDVDDEGRLSFDPDELRPQNNEQQQWNHVDNVNEDDDTSNNRNTATDSDEGSGYRTSQRDVSADDDRTTATDGYVLATGVAALGGGSLVVADYGAGCVCLCEDGEQHRVTGLKPFSVAASNDDEQLIYVGDRRRKTLLTLDVHGSDVAQWPDNQFDWICGIACLPGAQLAILDRARTRQLGIYATTGEDERPLTELGGQGSSLGDLCMAEFVASDSRGRVLVADSGNHCVKAFDGRVARPSVVAVYGSTRGSGDSQLQWPKGVAVDSADNVLVADYRNGRVIAFSSDGRPLGSVVPAVRGPFAVCALPTSTSDDRRRRRVAVATYSISGLSEFRLYDYNTDEIFV